MCYDDGGIVDDLLVYHMGDHYMLVINAANIGERYRMDEGPRGWRDMKLEEPHG